MPQPSFGFSSSSSSSSSLSSQSEDVERQRQQVGYLQRADNLNSTVVAHSPAPSPVPVTTVTTATATGPPSLLMVSPQEVSVMFETSQTPLQDFEDDEYEEGNHKVLGQRLEDDGTTQNRGNMNNNSTSQNDSMSETTTYSNGSSSSCSENSNMSDGDRQATTTTTITPDGYDIPVFFATSATMTPSELKMDRWITIIWCTLMSIVLVILAVPTTRKGFADVTKDHPYPLGLAKVCILGTMGELLGGKIASGRWKLRGIRLYQRMLIWALLGVIFTLTFPMFSDGVDGVLHEALLPGDGISPIPAIWKAFWFNMYFGFPLMVFHRMTDTLIDRGKLFSKWPVTEIWMAIDWHNMINVVFFAIFWFWIPAQVVTFSLPSEYRVISAALLAVVLGFILGLSKRKSMILKQKQMQEEAEKHQRELELGIIDHHHHHHHHHHHKHHHHHQHEQEQKQDHYTSGNTMASINPPLHVDVETQEQEV